MKKCQKCGFENTDIMNFCVECGDALSNEPQMVVPLDTVGFSNTEKTSEQVTEDYEKETVVNNRYEFEPQPTIANFQTPPVDSPASSSNTKLLLAFGGGLVALIALVGIAGAGLLFYAYKTTPSTPIVSSSPTPDDQNTSNPFPDTENSPENSTDTTPSTDETPTTNDNTVETETDEDIDTEDTDDEETITFPTPTNPTPSATYNVKNVSGWQLSDIETVPSELFQIKVSGKIDIDGVKDNVTAKGIKGNEERRIIKEFPTGALLMRTHYPDGKHSNIQSVSASQYWENYKDETGKIEFLINDNAPENNDGEFVIDFKMDKKPQESKK